MVLYVIDFELIISIPFIPHYTKRKFIMCSNLVATSPITNVPLGLKMFEDIGEIYGSVRGM